jgi:anti-anti-sigma factor
MLPSPAPWRLTLELTEAATLIGFQGSAIEIHPHEIEPLRQTLLPLAARATPQHLILDMGNVAYLTSDVIEMLLDLHHRLASHGSRLSVCRPTAAVAEIFATLGLKTLLDVRPDLPTGSATP